MKLVSKAFSELLSKKDKPFEFKLKGGMQGNNDDNRRRKNNPQKVEIDWNTLPVIDINESTNYNSITVYPSRVRYDNKIYNLTCSCAFRYLLISLHNEKKIMQDLKQKEYVKI